MDVLGERILLRRCLLLAIDDAGDRLVLRQPLLLDEETEREIAAAAGWHLERAGLLAVFVDDGTDVQALQQPAPADVLGELLDRDAVLHPPHILLRQHELVVGNVLARRSLRSSGWPLPWSGSP